MTYSITTLGGTIIDSGLSKKEADEKCQALCEEVGSEYYCVELEEKAKQDQGAKSMADLIKDAGGRRSSGQEEKEELQAEYLDSATGSWSWNEVINEGGEGYSSNNW